MRRLQPGQRWAQLRTMTLIHNDHNVQIYIALSNSFRFKQFLYTRHLYTPANLMYIPFSEANKYEADSNVMISVISEIPVGCYKV